MQISSFLSFDVVASSQTFRFLSWRGIALFHDHGCVVAWLLLSFSVVLVASFSKTDGDHRYHLDKKKIFVLF